MKKLCIAAMVATLALSALAPSAHAIGVMASWWNMNDANTDGFGFGIQQKFKLAPMVALDMRTSYINFKDSKLKVFPLEATGLLSLSMFYAGVGVGYYIFDANELSIDNNIGWYVLGGAEIGAGPVGVFGEVKWTSVSSDINDVKPGSGLPTSLSADGIGFNVGVRFGK